MLRTHAIICGSDSHSGGREVDGGGSGGIGGSLWRVMAMSADAVLRHVSGMGIPSLVFSFVKMSKSNVLHIFGR